MILLSALLASLAGLMSGERPVPRAQVERSVVIAAAQSTQSAAAEVSRPADPWRAVPASQPTADQATTSAPKPRVRTRLALKQSWRI